LQVFGDLLRPFGMFNALILLLENNGRAASQSGWRKHRSRNLQADNSPQFGGHIFELNRSDFPGLAI
jgi:hypothetical protein